MLLSSLRSAVAGLPAVFWYLWAGSLVNRLGAFVVPFLSLYLTGDRGLSVASAGAIVSMFGLGSVLGSAAGGVLADRIGRRKTLLLSLVTSAAGMVALGYTRDPLVLAMNTFALGFLTDLARPAIFALVADVVRPEDRLRAYAALYWAVNLGFSLAPIIAGLLAKTSFLLLFLGDAATTLLFAGIVLARIPETRPAHASGAPSSSLATALLSRGSLAEISRDGVFLAFTGLAFLLGVIFFQFSTTLALDMRAHGVAADRYGQVMALNGLLIVLLQPFAAKRLHRFRRSTVLAVASLLVGAGFGSYAWFHTVPLYALGIVVWTLGEIVWAPVSSAVVADLAPVHARGRYQGVYFMSFGMAAFAAPLGGAWLMERHGAAALWVTCFATGVALAAGHLLAAPSRRRRIETLRAHGLVAPGGAGD